MKKRDQIKPEDGTPVVSMSNLVKLTSQHGDIVGAIHQVGRVNEKKFQHSTLFFFLNGFVHECLGLELGTNTEKTCLCKSALQKIPFVGMMIEGETVSDHNYLNVKIGKFICHIFRPPNKIVILFPFIAESKGFKNIKNYVSLLYENKDKYQLEERW